MLTPAFDLKQDDDFLLLTIKAPYTQISEAEVFFEGTEFRFYSKPYFLRLIFPGSVVENGQESASYNADEGSFSIKIPKVSPGEWFEGLDLQTKLLAPKKKIFLGPLVEVIGTEQNNNPNDVQECEEEEFDWEIYQNPYTEEENNKLLLESVDYGFANQQSNVTLFTRLQEEMPDLLDIRHPHLKTILQRREEKSLTEEDDFVDDHYLADLYETEDIERILSFEPKWCKLVRTLNKNVTSADELGTCTFSDQEKEKMRNLPNKEYLFDQQMKKQILLGLVDILFAYAYDSRTTEGENTVESAWTISKLSSTLSWLESFSSLESVAITSVKRSLCYPLYRQWNLALLVLNDTADILSLGTKFVLKCLLQIHGMFAESEPRYILNDLYITDYCIWIQTVKDTTLHSLAQALKKVSFSKSLLGLDLPAIEEAADLVLQVENSGTPSTVDISQQLQALNLKVSDVVAADSDDDSSSSSSSDQSSSTTDSDDYSTSDNEDSSDDESDDSESGGEECLLLGNMQSIEKMR